MWTIIIIAIILIFLFSNSKRRRKGIIGEAKVASILKRLPSDDYLVLNDILIETSRGTCQIDHIVISQFGLFVIETKNYRGWIHGSEKSEYWTQSIYRYKTKFRNPIKQNWSHVFALKEIFIDHEKINYFPIVVFAGSAELKNVYSSIPVINLNQLQKEIQNTQGKFIITKEQIQKILDRLTTSTLHGNKQRREHIQKIKYRVREKNRNSSVCPKCGQGLVVRNGQYGKFIGCSNYPKCKFTKKYND